MALTREDIISRIDASDGPVDLSGLDLRGADLSRLDLRGANLSRADLSSADLRWTVLEGADLHATVLRRADARWAVLRGASLRQADLVRTNLGWADLAGADLTGAETDGASMDNADLSEVFVERRRGSGSATGGGAPWTTWLQDLWSRSPATTPSAPMSPPLLAAAAILLLLATHIWGWLYRRAYFHDGFDLGDAGVVAFFDPANLGAGLVDVIGLTLLVMILAPVIVLAVLLVVVAILAIPVAFYALASRLLRETVRPPGRSLVIGGLFIAFFVAFVLLIPTAVAAADRLGSSLPTRGPLALIIEQWSVGGWPTKTGFLLTLLGAMLPVWMAWRWLSVRAKTWQIPADWRLRYPALNASATALRRSPLVAGATPLRPEEVRRAVIGAAAVVVALTTMLTTTGEARAYRDMCDGGDLPRVQLYAEMPEDNGEFEPTIGARSICSRLLAQTDDAYFVFFPCATEPGTTSGTRDAEVRRVPARDVGTVDTSSSEHGCATCAEGCLGTEQALIDPLEEAVRGPLERVDTDSRIIGVVETSPEFEGRTSVIQVPTGVRVVRNGGRITLQELQAALAALGPDETPPMIEAFGRIEGEMGEPDQTGGGLLVARAVRWIADEEDAVEPTPEAGGTVSVDLSNPRVPRVIGAGWSEGETLEIGVVDALPGVDPSVWPFTFLGETVTVPPGMDGEFDVPLEFDPRWPTGPDKQLAVRAPGGRVVSLAADWLDQPPPTPTREPTPIPTIVREDTPLPDETEPVEGDGTTATAPATLTPEAPPTNTPFPQISGLPGRAPTCEDPDEFEFDDGRGFQKEISVGLGAGNAIVQTRNFCSPFDLDLAFFPVKAGRWYRVFTQNLAPGVDTVMAVGDLVPGTRCQPFHPTFGCWSDDRGVLSFASEIVFRAETDDVALVTVDNRGSAYGADAVYELGVEIFVPEPTATPTLAPSATRTPTRTATALPTPEKDPYENLGNDSCSQGLPLIRVGQRVRALLDSDNDEDFFLIDLEEGWYYFELDPPSDVDYDLDLTTYEPGSFSRATCNLIEASIRGGAATEAFYYNIPEAGRYALRVYTLREADPRRSYELVVRDQAPATEVPTAGPTPTSRPSATPRPTTTPSSTPTPPATPPPPPLRPTELLPSPTPTQTPDGATR